MAATSTEIGTLADRPAVARARACIRGWRRCILADQRTIARIPAPPFGETARARWMAERLRMLEIGPVERDAEGNVIAQVAGCETSLAPVIVAAHLDTAFPAGTETAVHRDGRRWIGPGIADNARGLAVLLALARTLATTPIRLRRPLALAATVGEEGAGDLRGVRHLFRPGSPWRRAAAFIALDGAGCRHVVDRALGAYRYRVIATGPGGHPWADAGRVNPLHTLGRVVAELTRLSLPAEPWCSMNVGRMAGGTGVNAIPDRAWLELELRSEDARTLDRLDERVRRLLARARHEANAEREAGTAPLLLELECIGHRPCGATPRDAAPVRAAVAATRFIGRRPERAVSSTDANLPIALGVPAITIGGGGEAGEVHTVREWYRDEGGAAGAERALLTVLALTPPSTRDG